MKFLHLFIFIGALTLCQAQSARFLNVRALALAADPAMPERYVKTEDGFAPLAFSSMEPCELVTALATDAFLPLFELIKNPDGSMAYRAAEKVNLPSGAKGVLVLGWGLKEGARYLAIDDDYLSAKYNEWLLINASPKAVAFQMGLEEKPVLIQDNSIKKHTIDIGEGSGVSVIGQAKWGEKTKTFYSTYWPIRGGERGIVIFFERGERVAVRKITDVLLKPVEKKPEGVVVSGASAVR